MNVPWSQRSSDITKISKYLRTIAHIKQSMTYVLIEIIDKYPALNLDIQKGIQAQGRHLKMYIIIIYVYGFTIS